MNEREQQRALIRCMLRARFGPSAAEQAAARSPNGVSSPGPEKPQTEDEIYRQALRVERIDKAALQLFKEAGDPDGELTIH